VCRSFGIEYDDDDAFDRDAGLVWMMMIF